METKEFGKLSRQQLRDFYALYYEAQQEATDLRREAKAADRERLRAAVLEAGGWGGLYVLPVPKLVALQFAIAGLVPRLLEASKTDDPHQALIDIAQEYDPTAPAEAEPTVAEIGTALSVTLAIQGNVDAIARFNAPMNELVGRIAAGDDAALFQAVTVDRAVVQAAPVGARIALAQLTDDTDFMNRLAKAIAGVKPRRPQSDIDDARLVMALLDDAIGLQHLTEDQLYDTLINDLQVYPDTGKDPGASLRKLLQKRRKQSRK